MASEDITPRTLIQGLIETTSVSKSAAPATRTRARRSNARRSSAGNRVAALRDGVGERPRSVSDLTPRSLIQGVLQNTDVTQPPASKRARLDTPPQASPPKPRTPRTLPKSSARGRKRAGRLETLATPGNDPTPRSLIQGLTQAAPVETPAVHLRRSSTLRPAEFPNVEDALHGRVESDTLSPLVAEPEGTAADRSSGRPAGDRLPRRRQPLSSADFAAGVREKLAQRPGDGRGGEAEAGEMEEQEEEEEEGVSDDRAERIPEAEGEGDGDGSQAVAPALPEAFMQDDDDDAGREEKEGGLSGDEAAVATEEEEEVAPRAEANDDGEGLEGAGGDDGIPQAEPERTREEEEVSLAAEVTPSAKNTAALADSSLGGSSSKQAADSTWTGRGLEATAAGQRYSSPGGGGSGGLGTQRLADSTVRDSSSDHSAASTSEQPAESETSLVGVDAGGDGHQTTVALSQSRLTGYSPLVTPRLPSGHGRPTPALKKTPAHLRPSTAETREQTSGAGSRKVPPKQKPPQGPRRKSAPCLPTSLTKSILSHFSKARVSKEAVVAAEKGAEVFFKRLANDMAVYSHHGHRQTVEQPDIELLMTRQGLIKDQQSMYALIEKYLPLEYRQELIPMAKAGNNVTPKPSH